MACQTLELTQLIAKKWTFVLLQEVSLHGKDGFNSMQRKMKISPKMLAQRIAELESAQIISKQSAPPPLKSEYFLTNRGKELFDILSNLQKWNAQYSQTSCPAECTSCPEYLKS